MKQELLAAVDEKFDVEAVAQMVEHLDFTKKLDGSLKRTFQGLQAELQQKDQMIRWLQGRLDNLELDIALLKRTALSPYPFPTTPVMDQRMTPPLPRQTAEPAQTPSVQTPPANVSQSIKPPDFFKLRAMTVAEPVNKFVPPPKSAQEVEST